MKKGSCLSVNAIGIADRLYAKTSSAGTDAAMAVMGAPVALPAAVMAPVTTQTPEGEKVLLRATSDRGRDMGRVIGGALGAASGFGPYLFERPPGLARTLLGRKPGLMLALTRGLARGAVGSALGGMAGGAGARSSVRLRGNYIDERRAPVSVQAPEPAPNYPGPGYYGEE